MKGVSGMWGFERFHVWHRQHWKCNSFFLFLVFLLCLRQVHRWRKKDSLLACDFQAFRPRLVNVGISRLWWSRTPWWWSRAAHLPTAGTNEKEEWRCSLLTKDGLHLLVSWPLHYIFRSWVHQGINPSVGLQPYEFNVFQKNSASTTPLLHELLWEFSYVNSNTK